MTNLHASLTFDLGSCVKKGVCAKVVTTGTTGTENEKSCSTWGLANFNNRFQIWLTK